ncbi:MAG: hypothetical protein AB1509_11320 [Chloroflexota bacterium]
MPEPNRSKRFKPGAVTDRLVPIVLVLLALALLAVIVIVLLSLM